MVAGETAQRSQAELQAGKAQTRAIGLHAQRNARLLFQPRHGGQFHAVAQSRSQQPRAVLLDRLARQPCRLHVPGTRQKEEDQRGQNGERGNIARHARWLDGAGGLARPLGLLGQFHRADLGDSRQHHHRQQAPDEQERQDQRRTGTMGSDRQQSGADGPDRQVIAAPAGEIDGSQQEHAAHADKGKGESPVGQPVVHQRSGQKQCRGQIPGPAISGCLGPIRQGKPGQDQRQQENPRQEGHLVRHRNAQKPRGGKQGRQRFQRERPMSSHSPHGLHDGASAAQGSPLRNGRL